MNDANIWWAYKGERKEGWRNLEGISNPYPMTVTLVRTVNYLALLWTLLSKNLRNTGKSILVCQKKETNVPHHVSLSSTAIGFFSLAGACSSGSSQSTLQFQHPGLGCPFHLGHSSFRVPSSLLPPSVCITSVQCPLLSRLSSLFLLPVLLTTWNEEWFLALGFKGFVLSWPPLLFMGPWFQDHGQRLLISWQPENGGRTEKGHETKKCLRLRTCLQWPTFSR